MKVNNLDEVFNDFVSDKYNNRKTTFREFFIRFSHRGFKTFSDISCQRVYRKIYLNMTNIYFL